MKEAELEQESKPRKYERIFIISFLTTIVLIIGSIVAVAYTGFKYTMYVALPILVSVAFTNDMQKRYKKY